jgi:2-isopropylmalate synthase
MNVEEKVVIARQLEKLGVDVIEAGFAAVSRRLRLRRPRRRGGPQPIVLSLARTKQADIEAAIRSVEKAKRPGHPHLHRHLRSAPRAQADDEPAGGGRRRLLGGRASPRSMSTTSSSPAEDASRSEPEYLIQVFAEVIRAAR